MSSEEENDYMSDSILAGLEDVQGDKPRKLRRDIEIYKRTKLENFKNSKMGKKILDEQQFHETSNKKLEANNIGYKMLQKMGFKDGKAIGKNESGIIEPIKVDLKKGRGGVGKDLEDRQRRQREMDQKLKMWKTRGSAFQSSIKMSLSEREARSDLNKIRKSCYNLDQKHDRLEPEHKLFWPQIPRKTNTDEFNSGRKMTTLEALIEREDENEFHKTEEDNFTEMDIYQLLVDISSYLRDTYFYCFWCGCLYENYDELLKLCPGNEKKLHD